jgi:ribonuclease BN (tRNA processing enzyme)
MSGEATFEVVVLGVGDAFSEMRRPTALLLVCDGFHLGVDCPDGYLAALRSASQRAGRGISASAVDHVLITHVHGDHMNGLEGFAFYKRLVEGRRIRLLASPEVRACIWDQRLAASMGALWDGQRHREMGFDDYFERLPLAWSEPATVGPFTIRARRTRHHVPTSALLVEAAGRTLGYSSDTSFDPELLAFLEPADVVIHETGLGPAHTPYAALAALPRALRRRMRLVHYPDSFDIAGSAIAALREGDVLQP